MYAIENGVSVMGNPVAQNNQAAILSDGHIHRDVMVADNDKPYTGIAGGEGTCGAFEGLPA